jgi:MFS family permease
LPAERFAAVNSPAFPGEAPTRRRYVVLAFLCVLSFLTYFDRIFLMRAQGDIQRDLLISDREMGLIFGAFFLAYALFEIPGGWMGDRYGARITLSRIVLAWSFFVVLSGTATGFLSLLLYRFLFGAGEAGAYPNIARVQDRWLPVRTHAFAGGLIWLMARWGGAFSPLLFGAMLRLFDEPDFREVLTSLHLPADLPAWRVAFWAAGLIGAVWVVIFFLWFRDDPAEMRSVNDAELRVIREGRTAAPHGHSMPWAVWRALLRSRSLWAIGLLYVLVGFGFSFFISWAPRYLKAVHDLDFKDSELMSGLPLFCGGISCLLGGALSDALVRRTGRLWLGRAVFPMCGYLVAAAAMFCVPYAQTRGQVAVLLCLAAAANDFGQGANWATIVAIGGRYAGTAAGFINMVGNGGSSLQPYVGALVFNSLGWNTLLAVYSVCYLGAASLWLFINPERTFYDEIDRPKRL